MERDLPFFQGPAGLSQEGIAGEVLETRIDVRVRDAADRDPVIVISLFVDVDRHLGHPVPEDAVDGPNPLRFQLDMIAVHVQAELVSPDVPEIAAGIGLGHDQDVEALEEGGQLARGQVPHQPESRFLGRLLVAVLGGGDENRRFRPVELRRRGRGLFGQDGQEEIHRPAGFRGQGSPDGRDAEGGRPGGQLA